MTINHVGIIPDGNRRHAKNLGLNPWKGHRKGAERVQEVVEQAIELGVKNLTFYIFSTENFNRSKLEVEFLMKLFKHFLKKIKDDKDFLNKGIRIRFAGDKTLFSKEIQKSMELLEQKTKGNNKLSLNLAMGYSGRAEILNAIKKLIDKKIPLNDIDEEIIKNNLYIKEDIDLIIRTSGEKRLSGFFPWQAVYSELFFIDKHWPDFTKEDFKNCVSDFEKRNRRYGQ